MPVGGAASRANHKAALAAVVHEKKVDPDLGDLLRELQERGGDQVSPTYIRPAVVVVTTAVAAVAFACELRIPSACVRCCYGSYFCAPLLSL